MPATKIRTALKAVGLVWDEFFTAGVTFASCPYRWVMPGSIAGEVVPATGASLGTPLGIIQNTPGPQGQARVRMMGKSLMAACMTTCNLIPGTWVVAGSHAGGVPSVCGLANARWAGSITLSASTANWGGYGEVYLQGPSFSTCIGGAS